MHEIIAQLIAWLQAQDFTPPIRGFTPGSALPPAAYPHLAVELSRQHFGAAGARRDESRCGLTLRLSCASGRPEEAQAQAQSLAAQVATALRRSGALGGQLKSLRVTAASCATQPPEGEPTAPLALARIEVEALLIQ